MEDPERGIGESLEGDVPWGVSLLPWNLILQILLLPVYGRDGDRRRSSCPRSTSPLSEDGVFGMTRGTKERPLDYFRLS